MHNFWNKLPRPITILAPMEDVTDVVFRRLVAHCGRPAVFMCEFVSTDGLCSAGRAGVSHRLRYHSEERPIVAQIWGNKPENYLKSAQLLCDMGFDGIDLNMGCPVRKIVKNGSCSALIENPSLARELYLATREGAPNLPISIKTRIGFRTRKTEEWCSFLLELRPELLTVHGRTAKDMSDVPADWEEIAKVRRIRDQMNCGTLIIGNGDVASMADADKKIAQYGVDGVMIGRGIFQDLFIFNSAATTPLRSRSVEEKLSLLLKHARAFAEEWEETKDFAMMKRFIKIYAANFAGASELRGLLMENSSSPQVLEKAVASWLAKEDCNRSGRPAPSNTRN